ncbi:MAG: hypothetical protein KF847_10955 [Pirellulales bacterium]|nr:hypothetical protein [Pirellulales bacterium]
MFKKMFAAAVVGFSALFVSAPAAEAGVIVGVAPVRRVATRAVLPPYPVARRVVATPVVRPVYRGPVVYGGVYGAPVYGPVIAVPGVSVGVGW